MKEQKRAVSTFKVVIICIAVIAASFLNLLAIGVISMLLEETVKKQTETTTVVSNDKTETKTKTKSTAQEEEQIDLPKIFTMSSSASAEQIKKYLDETHDNVNVFDFIKRTPLMHALQSNTFESIQVLLKAGAWVNTFDSTGRTPIFYAAKSQKSDVLKLLIDAKADLNVRLQDGSSLLMIASQFNHNADVFPLLIRHDRNINSRNHLGLTSLHIALANNNQVAVEALVEAGADLKSYDKNRATPILYACMYGSIKTIEFMLSAMSNLFDVDKFDNNALVYAAQGGSVKIVQYLLVKGFDVNSKNILGETALMHAAGKGTPEVVQILLDAGADKSLKTVNGTTAEDFAKRHKNEKYSQKILELL